jgi:uncharacterized protein YkwD
MTPTGNRTVKTALVGVATLFALVMASPAAFAGGSLPQPPGQVPGAAVSPEPGTANTDEPARAALDLTNKDRETHHVKRLKWDRKLSKYATKHSKQMADDVALYHTPNLASKLHSRKWKIAGENVGNGPSLDAINNAFMASPDHRPNILRNSFHHAAVGVYTDDSGSLWVTVIFYG